MTTTELAKQVKELRDAQKKFFEMRRVGNINTQVQLEQCKKLEKELDKTIAEVLKTEENKNQISLFK